MSLIDGHERWRWGRWRRRGNGDDFDCGLGGGWGGLDEADVVGGDAVEAVGLIGLAGVGCGGLGCGGLPDCERAGVVGDVDGVAGDATLVHRRNDDGLANSFAPWIDAGAGLDFE